MRNKKTYLGNNRQERNNKGDRKGPNKTKEDTYCMISNTTLQCLPYEGVIDCIDIAGNVREYGSKKKI